MKLLKYITENDNYKTEKDGTGHTHDTVLNADGDGKTVSTSTGNEYDEHEHIVYQWLVQPASGHIHNINI